MGNVSRAQKQRRVRVRGPYRHPRGNSYVEARLAEILKDAPAMVRWRYALREIAAILKP